MVTLQELRERHLNSIKDQETAKKGKESGTGEFAKFEKGDNWVRILPGKSEPFEFYAESHQHKYTDSEGNQKSYQCRKTFNQKCPLCDFYFDLWKRHKDLNLPKGEHSKYGNLATAIKPKERVYIRAVIRALEQKGEDPVKYFVATERLFKKIMGAFVNPDLTDDDDEAGSTIISLERGNDFNIRLTDQGNYVSFDESAPKLKKTKAHESAAKMKEWMDSPLDVRSMVKLEDYEDGKKIVLMLESTLNTVRTESSSSPDSDPVSPPFTEDDGESKFKQGIKV
jgi:gp32 DNA binding protein like